MLVPLCTYQAQTGVATRLYAGYGKIVWWGARAEIFSALTRLKRSAQISAADYDAAKKNALRLISNCRIVQPSATVESRAIALLENYPLRAADAFQLSAAFAWCQNQPLGNVFLTADRRLSEAAAHSGFTLEPGLVLP